MQGGIYCVECRHYLGAANCLAYPEGIASETFVGSKPHDKLRGDEDEKVHFEPLPELDSAQ